MAKEKDKPLKKGICPNCFGKLKKIKTRGWYCLNCGTQVNYGRKWKLNT